MPSGDVTPYEELLGRRQERKVDDRVLHLSRHIAEDNASAALRMAELESTVALLAGRLEAAGDTTYADMARGVLADDGGEWGEDSGLI